MRGKLLPNNAIKRQAGITPADAGKTFILSFLPLISKDHPRGCGENPETVRNLAIKQGSPPRMRGKPTQRLRVPIKLEDHPRGCGENRL